MVQEGAPQGPDEGTQCVDTDAPNAPFSWAAGSQPWPREELSREILRDFSVTMPRLQEANLDFSALPNQVQVALSFLRSLCPRSWVPDEEAARQPILLPPQLPHHQGRRTLVLDLDETLVHCHPTLLENCPPPALQVWIDVPGRPLHAHVYVRPYAPIFLEICASVFEVVVFTASAAIYADKVLDFLDPSRRCVAHRLYRQHCTELYGGLFKDLRRLGRHQRDVLLVDNSPLAAGLTPESAICCSSWLGDDYKDEELLHLLNVLERCATCESVPDFLHERYGFAAFLQQLRTSTSTGVAANETSAPTVETSPPAAEAPAAMAPLGQLLRAMTPAGPGRRAWGAAPAQQANWSPVTQVQR